VFAAMFNQRTDPHYQTIRHLVQSGELGAVRRVQWTITNWFRTEAYYGSGGWRATWAGEGGGVLLNQCPHNLDLFQWIFGLPQKVTGFCSFGRYHGIEVEDDVTAYFEYPNGTHATFITSTGEAPGTNRLEIAAELGRVVYEDERISYTRNAIPMGEFSRISPEAFGRPATTDVPVPACGTGGQHTEVLQNFVDAILDGVPLIAPGAEGIHSVELANAILLSAWTGKTVTLPLDGAVYEKALQAKIASSRPKAKPTVKAVVDLSKSVV
jgi:predicted dehydrogenase